MRLKKKLKIEKVNAIGSKNKNPVANKCCKYGIGLLNKSLGSIISLLYQFDKTIF